MKGGEGYICIQCSQKKRTRDQGTLNETADIVSLIFKKLTSVPGSPGSPSSPLGPGVPLLP